MFLGLATQAIGTGSHRIDLRPIPGLEALLGYGGTASAAAPLPDVEHDETRIARVFFCLRVALDQAAACPVWSYLVRSLQAGFGG